MNFTKEESKALSSFCKTECQLQHAEDESIEEYKSLLKQQHDVKDWLKQWLKDKHNTDCVKCPNSDAYLRMKQKNSRRVIKEENIKNLLKEMSFDMFSSWMKQRKTVVPKTKRKKSPSSSLSSSSSSSLSKHKKLKFKITTESEAVEDNDNHTDTNSETEAEAEADAELNETYVMDHFADFVFQNVKEKHIVKTDVLEITNNKKRGYAVSDAEKELMSDEAGAFEKLELMKTLDESISKIRQMRKEISTEGRKLKQNDEQVLIKAFERLPKTEKKMFQVTMGEEPYQVKYKEKKEYKMIPWSQFQDLVQNCVRQVFTNIPKNENDLQTVWTDALKQDLIKQICQKHYEWKELNTTKEYKVVLVKVVPRKNANASKQKGADGTDGTDGTEDSEETEDDDEEEEFEDDTE